MSNMISIFSSRHKLHVSSKQLRVVDLFRISHIYIYIYIVLQSVWEALGEQFYAIKIYLLPNRTTIWYDCSSMLLKSNKGHIYIIHIYIYIYIYVCVCVCVCVCVWIKVEKRKNPKFYRFVMKVDVERFGCNNLLQDVKYMKSVVKIAMDIWWNGRKKENVYKKKYS